MKQYFIFTIKILNVILQDGFNCKNFKIRICIFKMPDYALKIFLADIHRSAADYPIQTFLPDNKFIFFFIEEAFCNFQFSFGELPYHLMATGITALHCENRISRFVLSKWIKWERKKEKEWKYSHISILCETVSKDGKKVWSDSCYINHKGW